MVLVACCTHSGFNPRAPHGARLVNDLSCRNRGRVSIHAPRTGRDATPQAYMRAWSVSIHAPRTGRDYIGMTCVSLPA